MNMKLYQIVSIMAVSWQAIYALTGENVCKYNKSEMAIYPEVIKRSETDTSGMSCGFWNKFWRTGKCWKIINIVEETVTKTKIKWTTVPVCCSGFNKTSNNTCESTCSNCSGDKPEMDPDKILCLPTCSEYCQNGSCNDSKNCICSDDHEKNTFVQVSSEDCNDPGNCTCTEGYWKNTVAPFNCIPLCPKNCHNGTCNDPGNYTSTEGYWNCVTLCSEACYNNSCSNGYSKDICSCDDANCRSTSTCICSNGDGGNDTVEENQVTLPAENPPWGYIGAAVIILIIIAGASTLAYFLVKRSKAFEVIDEPVEPGKIPRLVLEENSQYCRLDVLPGVQDLQTSQTCNPQADCKYVNVAINLDTNTTTDCVQEDNVLYGAFEMLPLPADGNSRHT